MGAFYFSQLAIPFMLEQPTPGASLIFRYSATPPFLTNAGSGFSLMSVERRLR